MQVTTNFIALDRMWGCVWFQCRFWGMTLKNWASYTKDVVIRDYDPLFIRVQEDRERLYVQVLSNEIFFIHVKKVIESLFLEGN